MEIEVFTAALVLVASVCGGLCAVYIARSKSAITKHSRVRIKDLSEDYNNMIESNKVSTKVYKDKIRELNAAVSRYSRGETVTNNDLQNSSGLGEVIMQLIPNKYKKAASFLVPQVEEAVKKDPAIVERIYEKIKSANNQQAGPKPEDQTTDSL
jgi:hypothetical protein